MGPLFIFLAILSLPAWSSVCSRETFDEERCYMLLSGSIFQNKLPFIKELLKKEGTAPFFSHWKSSSHYQLIFEMKFFHRMELLNSLVDHPEYPSAVPDRSLFLSSLFTFGFIGPSDVKIVETIFFHHQKEKSLDWWDNPRWPYPLFSELKEQFKNDSHYGPMFAYFDKIDALKKNVCSTFDDLEKLEKAKKEFPGIEKLFQIPEYDLFTCAVKNDRMDLAKHLIEKGAYDQGQLLTHFQLVEGLSVTPEHHKLLTAIHSKMNEFPDLVPQSGPTFWLFDNYSQLDCLQASDFKNTGEITSFANFNHQVVFKFLVARLEKSKALYLSGEKEKFQEELKVIMNTFKKGGLPYNLQDEQGRTALHYLMEFIDGDTLDKLEKEFNAGSFFNYKLQDKNGDTPLHVALKSGNLSGALAMSDNTTWTTKGFGMGLHYELVLKNAQGHTPFDLAKKMEVIKSDKDKKKLIIERMRNETALLENSQSR